MPLAAAIIPAVIGAGASIGGAAISSSGANSAARTQASAATYAADLQKQAADQALNFQKQQYANSLQISQPWIQQGQGAISNLGYLMGIPGNYSYQGQPQPGGQPPAQMNPSAAMGGSFAPSTWTGGDNQVLGGNGAAGMPKTSAGVGGGAFNDAAGTFRTAQGGSYDPATNSYSYTAPTTPSTNLNLPTPQVNPQLGGFGSLMTPWTQQFQAPTNITEQNDPGFKFRLQQGQQAIERSAAAKGGLLTGGTGKALQRYGQDYASNEYGNVYNRAFNEYSTSYNQFKQNQTDQYNKLANLSGMGQVSAGQLNNAGMNMANQGSNILMASAQNQGNAYQNAAAARATGYQNSGNIWGNTMGQLGSLGAQAAYQYYNQQPGQSQQYPSPGAIVMPPPALPPDPFSGATYGG